MCLRSALKHENVNRLVFLSQQRSKEPVGCRKKAVFYMFFFFVCSESLLPSCSKKLMSIFCSFFIIIDVALTTVVISIQNQKNCDSLIFSRIVQPLEHSPPTHCTSTVNVLKKQTMQALALLQRVARSEKILEISARNMGCVVCLHIACLPG